MTYIPSIKLKLQELTNRISVEIPGPKIMLVCLNKVDALEFPQSISNLKKKKKRTCLKLINRELTSYNLIPF